jgi:2-dehydro-3-deoxyglucarate aldolase
VGYNRANLFGQAFDAYRSSIDPFVVAQIEHRTAIEDIEAILSVEGLDAVMIGPYDLSASMGLTGQFEHPDFKAAVSRYQTACRKFGVPSGTHVVEPDADRLSSAIAQGHRFIAYATDAVFLWHSACRPKL